ncbi:MAG: UDP-N-acetylmuramoyl-tripeptide--D-alanyl-D-alanine ligase [Bacilli bacterium]|nr:UDP-N-acetylmuramoyl-tripeptide--D-alanyl-D-alanine ligase [Bacilli bacterium]
MYTAKEISKIINGNLIYDNSKNIDTFTTNSKKVNSNGLFIPIIGQKYDGNDFILDAIKNGVVGCLITKNYKSKKNIIRICKKKNIALIEVDDTLEALSKLAHHNRLKNKDTILIAITGSNGKTSTKDILYDVLKYDYNVLKTEGNLNNHIGLPLTLLKLKGHDICILEMGMNHLGEIEKLSKIALPDIAIITNIGTAHIGLLGSRENILKAKLEICTGLKENGLLILNKEDDYLNSINLNNHLNICRYGYDDITDLKRKNNKINFKIQGEKIKINEVGEFDLINSILAYKIASHFNIKPNKIKKYLKLHKNPKMRMELIKYKNNLIINDSYNANYDSMKSGIEFVLKKYQKKYHILLYLGDMLELGEWSKYYHHKIGTLINSSNIDVLYTSGNEIKFINEAVNNLKIIKKELKINSDNDYKLISDSIKLDLNKYKRSVVYFKSSRKIGLDKIVNSIISE